ncbi:hypothetical protein TEA_021707 [Camellia sinensis var. sinensis]|uniref:Uncharacterized protein n=1 Tax=Camellia sinensis var. sinensis TaxID=542762 RepID=A0A4S4E0Y5_CAMSN|nr:hypothetical protein TEA_021707 [Camellia sinensis var. sinensis]
MLHRSVLIPEPSMVHKELQDTIAQLEAIRHEIRTVSFMNPGPLTRRLVDNLDQTSAASGNNEPEKPDTANRSTTPDAKNYGSTNSGFSDMHSQATAYAKLAESTAINSGNDIMQNNLAFELPHISSAVNWNGRCLCDIHHEEGLQKNEIRKREVGLIMTVGNSGGLRVVIVK